MTKAQIASLHHYPLKSARGLALEQALLLETGFAHDRQWLVVDERDRFVTQRELPLLATLEPQLRAAELILRSPQQRALTVPMATMRSTRRVQIWGSEFTALDCGDDAADWLSKALGRALRLVQFDATVTRLSSNAWTGSVQARNLFTDGFPILVANMASLTSLNTRLQRALPMERFRPNIVLDGLPAFAEDSIAELHCGAVRLRLVKPCTRCVITTTDQRTGARDGDEPLRTLKSFRHDQALKGVTFAQNAIIVGGIGARLNQGGQFEVHWKHGVAPPVA